MVELVGQTPTGFNGMTFTTPEPMWKAISEVLDGLLAPSTLDDLLVVGECLSGQEEFGSATLLALVGQGLERAEAEGTLGETARRHGVEVGQLVAETRRLLRFLRSSGSVVLRQASRGL
jgi:hypothetical protein